MENKATTHGIEVSVESFYIPEQSIAERNQYVFAYRVQLTNHSEQTVQLLSRHWIITDGDGEISEVKGSGVIGEQPTLQHGEQYQYMSGSHMKTKVGTMAGTYQMKDPSGKQFDIEIPCFRLAVPNALN